MVELAPTPSPVLVYKRPEARRSDAPLPWFFSGSDWGTGFGPGGPTAPWSGFFSGFPSPTSAATTAGPSSASTPSTTLHQGSASDTASSTSSSSSSGSNAPSATQPLPSPTTSVAAASHENNRLIRIILPVAIAGAFVVGLMVATALFWKRTRRRRAWAWNEASGRMTQDVEGARRSSTELHASHEGFAESSSSADRHTRTASEGGHMTQVVLRDTVWDSRRQDVQRVSAGRF